MIQNFSDKLAIGLSALCLVHCLALPVLLILLPSLTALSLDNEAFHIWMVVAVVPISIYALFMGYRQHHHYRILAYGAVGLLLLVLALALEERVGEWAEKTLTVLGAVMIALGHYKNFKLCQRSQCSCHEH